MVISPVWVICALEDAEFSKLKSKLERQFQTITCNELGNDYQYYTWWVITNIPTNTNKFLSDNIDDQGHPTGMSAFKAPSATFDTHKFTVIYYGNTETFLNLFNVAKELQKSNDNSEILKGAHITQYGLCVVTGGNPLPKGLKGRITKLQAEKKPAFDKLLFQGDINQNEGNRLGYDALLEEEKHDLSVQIISHLALVRDSVANIERESKIMIVGGYSLTYEKELEKNAHALSITQSIIEKSCKEESDERWYCDRDAIMSTDIKNTRTWKGVYNDLSSGFEDEELKDIYPESEDDISPWTLFSKYMIPLYFGKYIHSFVKILHRNVNDFSTKSYIRYNVTLENNFYKITGADLPRKEIRDELMSVWKKDNVDGALGVKQCILLLKKVKSFYEDQKTAIENMKNGKAPDKKNMNFPGPYDFPMKKLGKFRSSFEKYWSKKRPTDKKKIASDTYGSNLLEKLTKVLKYHPIPLSLIARSILAGLFLPFAIYIILRIIPDVILNTQPLEEGTGKTILFCSTFAICILWGIFKYSKLILDKIKSLACDYIGWFIYKTQKLMFEDTLDRANIYYEKCLGICAIYEQYLKDFCNAEAVFRKNAEDGFEQTMFQSDITKTFRGFKSKKSSLALEDYLILQDNIIESKATITKQIDLRLKEESIKIDNKNMDTMNQLYADLTRTIINFDPKKTLFTLLEKVLFPESVPSKEEEKKEFWKQRKEQIIQSMMAHIMSQIEFYVRDNKVSNISDIAFTSTALLMGNPRNFNFRGPVGIIRNGVNDIYTNTLITSRLQPSVQHNVVPCPPIYISILFPVHNKFSVSYWKECFFNNLFDTQIHPTQGSIGIASMLSAVPLESANVLK